jgi:hypothetical protein
MTKAVNDDSGLPSFPCVSAFPRAAGSAIAATGDRVVSGFVATYGPAILLAVVILAFAGGIHWLCSGRCKGD